MGVGGAGRRAVGEFAVGGIFRCDAMSFALKTGRVGTFTDERRALPGRWSNETRVVQGTPFAQLAKGIA